MFDLVYNIDFEIAAFLVALLLYIETRIHYPRQNRRNRIFGTMTLLVIITDVFDIASAFSISCGGQIPRFLNILINSGYFMSGLALCFALHSYIQAAFVPPEGKAIFPKANRYILIIMELSIALNAVFGYYFTFSREGEYMHGPLFLVMHFASCWFVLCASATLVVNHRILQKDKVVSGILLILLYFAAVVLQTFVFPNVLIIMPTVSVMLIIAIFSLESPDYTRLQGTLRELTQAKSELEAANEKYRNLAYVDLMTGLKNRTAYNIQIEQLGDAPGKERVIFLIADVNDLKKLNDRFGHLIGDDAISKAAELLQKSFGEKCRCYRIGGDEFAVISDELSEEEFLECCRQFLDGVEQTRKNVSYPFSVAVGYQAVGGKTLVEAQKRADKNMYADKKRQKRGGVAVKTGIAE